MVKIGSSLLGFLKINCTGFKTINYLVVLYCALVRSILKFGYVVSNLFQSGLNIIFEKLQRRFIHIFGFRIGFIDRNGQTV